MFPTEISILRMKEQQPKTPSWAQAEQMETAVPQLELWRGRKTVRAPKAGGLKQEKQNSQPLRLTSPVPVKD